MNPNKEFYSVVLNLFNIFERKSFSICTVWYFTHFFTYLTYIFQSLLNVKSVLDAKYLLIIIQGGMRLWDLTDCSCAKLCCGEKNLKVSVA